MFEFITRFKNNKNTTITETSSTSSVNDNFEKYLERIKILENKNLVLSKKLDVLEKKSTEYENKYHSLLKASREEINRIVDARKLLASDPNYRKDLRELGLISQKDHSMVIEKYHKLEGDYQSLKTDYDLLSRKLNNILSEKL